MFRFNSPNKKSPKKQNKAKTSRAAPREPCKKCKDAYVQNYKTSDIKAMIQNGDISGNDGHFTPYDQYKTMLKDERHQFDKMMKIINQA